MSPETFWADYRERMRRGRWTCYQDNTTWTEFAKTAAEATCGAFGLPTSREYFRLDVCAWAQASSDRHDWRLRVAFEVEARDWTDELCKLAHVHADLKVLVGYEQHVGRNAADLLQDRFALQCDVLLRPGERWLIVFGPRWQRRDDRWSAYTLTADGVVSIGDVVPLTGIHMSD